MDIKQLRDQADIETVCINLGIEITKKGTAFFVKCPSHSDEHPSAFFKKGDNYIYCPVCRKNINAIDVIKDVRNCSIKDAIKELSEIEGIVSTTVPRYNSNSIRPSDIRMVGIKCSDDSEEYFSKKEFKEYIKFCIGKTKDRIHEISEFLDIDLKEEAEIKKIERKL